MNGFNRFAMGFLAGGAAVMTGYLLRDEKKCKTLVRKGKKAAMRAEEIMEDMADTMKDMM